MQPVYAQTDKKSSRMARCVFMVMGAGMVVFLSFQVGVYASRPGTDRSVWGTDEAGIVASNNLFALKLFKGLRGDDDTNLFFSPFSISSALAMTMLGAQGTTAEQMVDVLHFDHNLAEEVLHGGFKTLLKELLSKEEDHYILRLANRVYLQEGYNFLDSFKDGTKEYYDAQSQHLDFQRSAETARKVVNQWVEDVTQDKIKELLKPGTVSDLTRFVLVNAIYFKGNWQNQFNPKLTREKTFHVNDQHTATVDMMFQKETFLHGFNEDLNAQILELPYLGKDLSMVLLLPREKYGLKSMQDKLTGDLTLLTKGLQNSSIEVHIPKFNMTCDFNLVELLQRMGMTDLFSEKADLSRINGHRDLSVSHVIHKAFIDVNEEGSEAAAATAVVGTLRAMSPASFRADHPFAFFIRHEKTNSILFLGRYVQPPSRSTNTPRDDL